MVARIACAALTVLVAVAIVRSPARSQSCDVRAGQAIVLASTSSDPDVFVWDSRVHLVDYAAGAFDDAKAVMAHTRLAKPGTRAIVTSCVGGALKPRYEVTAHDAIGVKLTSGPFRGSFGWVASDDVHLFNGVQSQRPSR